MIDEGLDTKKITLKEIINIFNLPVRTINVCLANDFRNLDKIIQHYLKEGNFKGLKSCGKKTNEELISICENYLNQNEINDNVSSSEELTTLITTFSNAKRDFLNAKFEIILKKISTRAFNILSNLLNQTFTISSFSQNIIQQNINYGTLKNIGIKTEKELFQLNTELVRLIYQIKPLRDEELKQLLPSSLAEKLITRIYSLSPRKKRIVNIQFKILKENLSKRAINVLLTELDGEFSINRYSKNIIQNGIEFRELKNIGKKTEEELVNFHKEVIEHLNTVSEISSTYEVNYYFLRIFLKSNLKLSIKDIETILFFYKRNSQRLPIFTIVFIVVKNTDILNNHQKALFTDYFLYNVGTTPKILDTISVKTGVTRERIRQIRNKTISEFNNIFSFIKTLHQISPHWYGVDEDASYIAISEQLVNKINKEEGTSYSKLFMTKILAILLKESHILVGDEISIHKVSNNKHQANFKNLYLISNNINKHFDFRGLLDSLHSRLSKTIKVDYKLNLKGLLLDFLSSNSALEKLNSIQDIAEDMILNELGIFTENDNLKIPRNVSKQIWEYALEALEDLGPSQTGHKIEKIGSWLNNQYPTKEFIVSSLSNSMRQQKQFIYFGRSSSFGLKKWEKEFEGVKGGSIRDIVVEYLEKFDSPKHINEIADYVYIYRKTTKHSLIQNLRLDETNTFAFYGNNQFGLVEKSYSTEYSVVKESSRQNSWEENFNRFVKFIEHEGRLPKSNNKGNESNLYAFYYRTKKKYEQGGLSDEKSKLFSRIGGKFILPLRKNKKRLEKEPKFDNWETAYKKLLIFKEQEPLKWPSQYGDSLENSLYFFCLKQRKLFKQGKLSQEYVERLEDINFPFDKTRKTWVQNFESLVEFRKLNPNRWPVRKESKKEEKLYYFCYHQRKNYKEENLSNKQINQLKSIGFDFIKNTNSSRKSWEEHFKSLSKFRKNNPNRWPSSSNNDAETKLYHFCYQNNQKFKENKLSINKIELLESLEFEFTNRNNILTWEEHFENLNKFVKEYKHLPRNNQNNTLYIFCLKIRREFNDNLLTEKQIQQLNTISFPLYKGNISFLWIENYELLIKFKDTFPDRWPSSTNLDEKKLYQFCYRCKKFFRENKLSTYQINLLEKIKFNFS